MLNRTILILSLVGMVLAVHLWIQKARGFDQGCLGIRKPSVEQIARASSEGCTASSLEAASHILGVSNAAWAYAFFFGLSLVSFSKAFVRDSAARRLHLASEAAIVPAALYACYLVFYQAFVAHAFCVLCLTTAALIGILFILHLALRLRGGYRPAAEPERATELGYAVGSLFAAMGLMVAVLVFVNRIGTRPLDQGESEAEIDRVVGTALPLYIDGRKLMEMRSCRFDPNQPRKIDLAKLIDPDMPFIGNPGGVPVVVFYDPNCPHCREHGPLYLKLAEQDKDRGKFYILPRMLWDFSLLQMQAIELARQEGKYFEMWRLMLDRQLPRGMGLPDIEKLFAELGLPTENLKARLDGVLPATRALLRRSAAVGVTATPTTFIGGWRVFSYNGSAECVGTLVDRVVSAEKSARK
jgi:protein-disulfide isomerase/uncharacterized membrane protein